jgi:hypothetical protein
MGNSGALTRGDFRGSCDMRRQKVDLPGRNGFVFIREMNAREMLEFGDKVKTDPKTAGMWLMCKSIVDESGERIFRDDELEQMGDSLTREDFASINNALMKINGMAGDDLEKN